MTVYEKSLTGVGRTWERTEIRAIERNGGRLGEDFLEEIIAECPDLLGLADVEDTSSVAKPFKCFRQVQLQAFDGRSLAPDVVILCQSGDVVVVEVKLSDNRELRGRPVVGQVLEYAACFAQVTEQDLLRMFGQGEQPAETWTELVARWFEKASDHARLARQFLERFRRRNLHLVIACDNVPHGLRELVEGVVGQEAVGEYRFHVVEIVPYVPEDKSTVMLVSNVRITTAIVARTAVSVEVRGAGEPPTVQVQVTPFQDSVNAETAARQRAGAKAWDEASFFAAAQSLPEPNRSGLRQAYDHFCTSPGFSVQFGRGATVGTVRVRTSATGQELVQLATDGLLWVMFNDVQPATAEKFRTMLSEAGLPVPEGAYRALRAESWVPKLPELLAVVDRAAGELEELRERA